MLVSDAIGEALAGPGGLGADTVFGLVGSGNFHVTNALIARGARFIAARHECGAAGMADAWARLTGRVGVLTLHQGPGITNALTALTEAAKSRTPLLVLAADVSHAARRSNFRIDVAAIAVGIGATPARLHSPGLAVDDVVRAYRTAAEQRRCVLLALPLDIQSAECEWPAGGIGRPPAAPAEARPAGPARPAQAAGVGGTAQAGGSAKVGGACGAAGAARTSGAGGAAGAAGSGSTDTAAGAGRPAREGRAAGVAGVGETAGARAAGRARAAGGAGAVAMLAERLGAARRPVFIAGRGARAGGPAARAALDRLAGACGALLATSAAAKGLFRGSPWDLDVSGGFATPLAAELIQAADLVVGWGSSLNMWTTRQGTLIGPDAVVAQVDLDPAALGAHRPVHVGVAGDVTATALAVADLLDAAHGDGEAAGAHGDGEAAGAHGDGEAAGAHGDGEAAGDGPGYRSAAVRERIARAGRWRDVPFTDGSYGGRIDPRTLTIALDDLLPAERVVAIDSGNFMGYPAMFLDVPDASGFTFTQAFQSIGLGLASAIGSAIARPDRLTVAALGDGGALMSVSELETAARLGLPMLIVVYNDDAYGAEVHHFGPDRHPLETVVFPPADIAAIARGFGCAGVTVRSPADLAPVRQWLADRDRPMLIDAKVTADHGSWWLEEAFRGH